MYENFIDRSKRFGKLFVAVDITELRNKMASYMTDQRVFVIKIFHSSNISCVPVQRQYHRQLSVRVAPSTGTVYRIIKQLEETGSACDDVRSDVERRVYS